MDMSNRRHEPFFLSFHSPQNDRREGCPSLARQERPDAPTLCRVDGLVCANFLWTPSRCKVGLARDSRTGRFQDSWRLWAAPVNEGCVFESVALVRRGGHVGGTLNFARMSGGEGSPGNLGP